MLARADVGQLGARRESAAERQLTMIIMGNATIGEAAAAALRAECEAREVDLRMISKVGERMWWGLCASVHSVHDALKMKES